MTGIYCLSVRLLFSLKPLKVNNFRSIKCQTMTVVFFAFHIFLQEIILMRQIFVLIVVLQHENIHFFLDKFKMLLLNHRHVFLDIYA